MVDCLIALSVSSPGGGQAMKPNVSDSLHQVRAAGTPAQRVDLVEGGRSVSLAEASPGIKRRAML